MSQHASGPMLRQRAAALRHLAEAIETTPAMSLEHAAGDDTWRGPRPMLCRNVLIANLAQLHHAAEDLRMQAWQLESRADRLDATAFAAQPGTG